MQSYPKAKYPYAAPLMVGREVQRTIVHRLI